MKCAVIPCIGLGDALIALVLSHNLVRAGHQVDTFHPFISQLQPFFPHLPLLPRKEGVEFLNAYDRIFFFYEKLDWMQKLIDYGLKNLREKITILNPIATPNCNYPFWEEGRFNGSVPFVDNLVSYAQNILGLKDPVRTNGIQIIDAEQRKYPNRIIIHPTSSRPGKNWTQRRYIDLSTRLKSEGFQPVFILTKEEKLVWPSVEAPDFKDLCAVANYIAESGWMIGNDSGIGHLASCLGVPTLTICRSMLTANFWRPAWSEGKVLVPPNWIPNLKGMRWRDKKWQYFVPVSRVHREFLNLRQSCVLCD